MGDMVGNNSFRKSNYLRLEKTPVQKVPKIELIYGNAHNCICILIVLFLLDAISQNLASSKKRKRQEEKGTYEQYQQEQKRRQRIKRVRFSVMLLKTFESKF